MRPLIVRERRCVCIAHDIDDIAPLLYLLLALLLRLFNVVSVSIVSLHCNCATLLYWTLDRAMHARSRSLLEWSHCVQAQAQAEAEDKDFDPENPEAGTPEAGTEEAS